MIRLNNVTRCYKKRFALRDFSCHIQPAPGITGVIGPNGAGKTTLFKLLSGLLLPNSGTLTAGEERYAQWARRNTMLIPAGDRSLYSRNTLRENALYQGVLKGGAPAEVKERIARYAPVLGMETFLDLLPEACSSGMRKQAALLCGMCADVRLLLLDEPSWGLDIAAAEHLQRLLRQLGREKRLLIASHDVHFVTGVADQYLFINQGACIKTVEGPLDARRLTSMLQEVGHEAS